MHFITVFPTVLLPYGLQDDVPCFPDKIAFEIIRAELGRPIEEVFSSFSERPIAAASLGQVSEESDCLLKSGSNAYSLPDALRRYIGQSFVTLGSRWR